MNTLNNKVVLWVLSLAMLSSSALIGFNCQASVLTEHGVKCIPAKEYIGQITVSQTHINQVLTLQKIIARIGKIIDIVPPLYLCETDRLRVGAYVTKVGEPIRVETKTLDLFGSDEDMMAWLIGHELSHLHFHHVQMVKTMVPSFSARGQNIANRIYRQTGDIKKAKVAYILGTVGSLVAYRRNQEAQADDYGIQIASDAGFKPDGAKKFLNALFAAGGKLHTGFFDDHPGLFERYEKTSTRVRDEQYGQASTRYINMQQWEKLALNVDQWTSTMPYSANAWYFESILLSHEKRHAQELAALENTFTYDEPSLNEHRVNVDAGKLALCEQLYFQGHLVESGNCSKMLSGDAFDKFKEKTFKGILYVAGPQPLPINLMFIKKQDGSKLITNGQWPNNFNGVKYPLTAWHTMRYESEDDIAQK